MEIQYLETPYQLLPIENLELALKLANHGWFIFPCNLDKTPKMKWKDRSTTNEAEIREWWTRWPEALIGIYCHKSGFFVVDIDVKNGHNGFETWTKLINIHCGGDQPILGPIQDTPSGGRHLLFTLPADIVIPNNAGKLGDGLDLRSDGYICTGGAYHWQPDHGPALKLTPAPVWLLDLIQNMSNKTTRMPQVRNESSNCRGNDQIVFKVVWKGNPKHLQVVQVKSRGYSC